MFRIRSLLRAATAATLLVLFGGCATLGGRRQIVSVDSSPRGLDVVDPEDPGKVLGKTPLFVQLPRGTSHDFKLRTPAGAAFTSKMDCDFRWRGALLGNAPLALVGGVGGPVGSALLYGTGNAVDLATGAAWECPWRFHVDAEWSKKPADPPVSESCPTLVVLPPEHPDEKISDLVATRWRERLEQSGSCAKLADADATASYFRRYNVTHDASLVPSEVDPPRLNELGFRTGATHAVVLDVRDDGRFLKVIPTRWDLHDLRTEIEQSFNIDLDAEQGVRRGGFLSFVARYLRLLPNSVAFSAAQKTFYFEGLRGQVLSDQPTASVLPSVLSNWTVAWVEHPDQHGAWDATFGLSPSLLFGYNSRNLTVANEDGGAARTLEADLVHAIVVYEAAVGFHTPVGKFGAALGLGGGFAWTWEDATFRDWTWNAYADARIDYTAFLTENLFLQLAVESFASGDPNAQGDRWQLAAVRQTSLTLGYYLPQMRSAVRSLF